MTGPADPGGITAQLALIYSAVGYLSELEGQDRDLVIGMSQAMLADVIGGRGLQPMAGYAGHYCDVIDTPADAERIAAAMSGEE